jgi:hypothetical protein
MSFRKLTLSIVSKMDIDFTFYGAVRIASGSSSWTIAATQYMKVVCCKMGCARSTFNVTLIRLELFFHMTRIC